MQLSVVIPVYNEEGNLRELCRRLKESLSGSQGLDSYELLFVNDGSQDGTLEGLQQLKQEDSTIKILNLSRNFGHQVAITAGVDHAQGDAVAVMDADLQDPPELLIEMHKELQSGYDVVYGRRRTRKGESSFKLLTASLFYRMMRSVTKIDIPLDTGDFRMMSRRVVEGLSQLREHDRFVRGLVSWVGYRQKALEYDRDERLSGETKYPLKSMIKFAWDGLTAFSTLPLKLASTMGMLSILLGLLYATYALFQVFFHESNTQKGWTSLVILILFFSGVILMILGVMGEYIGRISNEVKNRPLYLIESFEE